MNTAARSRLALLGALAALALLVLVALSVGRYPVSIGDAWRVLLSAAIGQPSGLTETIDTVILRIRLPRVAAALVIGASLAAAGAAYQNLFRNPLVSPDILGVSSGAGLGAVVGILAGASILVIQAAAFAGGLAAVALIYLVGSAVRARDPVLALVLTGIVVGSLFGSGIALAKYLADAYNQLPAITYWLLGSLASLSAGDLALLAPISLAGLVVLLLARWRINLLTLPDDEARALGVNVRQLRLAVIIAATLMTAAAVAAAGIIGWIGLIVPHAARLVTGPQFTRLLPLALVLGGAFMLAVDTLARSIAAIEVPPGVLTAVIGSPLFIWLLIVSQRSEARR